MDQARQGNDTISDSNQCNFRSGLTVWAHPGVGRGAAEPRLPRVLAAVREGVLEVVGRREGRYPVAEGAARDGTSGPGVCKTS